MKARASERSELEYNEKATQQGQSVYSKTVQISKYIGRLGSPARRHGKVKSEKKSGVIPVLLDWH